MCWFIQQRSIWKETNKVNVMEVFSKVVLLVVLLCSSSKAQTATLQTSSNSEEIYTGRSVTLTCDVENGFDVTRHQIYWSKMDGTKETFLSADRTIYPSVEPRLQRRLSITGDIKQGFFNLKIKETRIDDAGIYMCVLFDRKGIDKASLRLDLTVKPVRRPDPGYPKCTMSPKKPKLNDRVTFTCTSKGSIPKVSLNWMRADDSISQQNVANQKTNGVFTQHVITENDNMVPFTCIAHGTALLTPINCSVVPFSFPTVVNIAPSIKKMKIGQDATLTCSAVAIPSPDRFKWTYGKGSQFVKLTQSTGRFELLNNGQVLKIKNISKSDDNSPVKCIVRNLLDIKGSKEITLKVQISATPKTTTLPKINPRGMRPKPTKSIYVITKNKRNRPNYPPPHIPANERVPKTEVTVESIVVKNNIPTGVPPLFDKHTPTNTGRAGLLTGGLIGIACLLGAIFLVALMLMKLKRDESSGNLVLTRKIEHSVTYTPERYMCNDNNTSYDNRNFTNNEDSELSEAVRDRLQTEHVLRESIIASQTKDTKQTDLKQNNGKNLGRTTSSDNGASQRRPNLVFKRFARPTTASYSSTKSSVKANSLPTNCNVNTKPVETEKIKQTKNNVEGLLYADLDFTNVKTSQRIIPNSSETTYADITNFLKK